MLLSIVQSGPHERPETTMTVLCEGLHVRYVLLRTEMHSTGTVIVIIVTTGIIAINVTIE
jgi:hypothetical protein